MKNKWFLLGPLLLLGLGMIVLSLNDNLLYPIFIYGLIPILCIIVIIGVFFIVRLFNILIHKFLINRPLNTSKEDNRSLIYIVFGLVVFSLIISFVVYSFLNFSM